MIAYFKTISKAKLYLSVVFIIALGFRILLINTINETRITPDGTGYHTVAVNLVQGNGYSLDQNPPYSPYFLREPGYPVFLASIYKLYDLFGGKVSYITDYDLDTYTYTQHNEIVFAKYIQAIIDSISIILFYLSLLFLIRRKYAFIIAVIISLYYPHAIHVTFILRETLQTVFSMFMTFAFLKYLDTRKNLWIVLFSVGWGFLTLTFHAFIILPLFLFIFLFIQTKDLWLTVKKSIVAGIIFIVLSTPWLARTYSYHNDWRIIKSYGTSLTREYQSYIGALEKAKYYSKIDEEDFHDILMSEYINLSPSEKFDISFNGVLKAKADSVNNVIGEAVLSKRKIVQIANNFRRAWFRRISFDNIKTRELKSPKFTLLGIKVYSPLNLFFTIFGFGVGLVALFGLLLFYKKLLPMLLVFTMYMSIFFILGSESRRMIPVQPFVTMFSILAVFVLYFLLIKKKTLQNSISELLHDKQGKY